MIRRTRTSSALTRTGSSGKFLRWSLHKAPASRVIQMPTSLTRCDALACCRAVAAIDGDNADYRALLTCHGGPADFATLGIGWTALRHQARHGAASHHRGVPGQHNAGEARTELSDMAVKAWSCCDPGQQRCLEVPVCRRWALRPVQRQRLRHWSRGVGRGCAPLQVRWRRSAALASCRSRAWSPWSSVRS